MTVSDVKVTDEHLMIRFGKSVLVADLSQFPVLQGATEEQRRHWQLIGDGEIIRWPDIDEDIEPLRLWESGQGTRTVSRDLLA